MIWARLPGKERRAMGCGAFLAVGVVENNMILRFLTKIYYSCITNFISANYIVKRVAHFLNNGDVEKNF